MRIGSDEPCVSVSHVRWRFARVQRVVWYLSSCLLRKCLDLLAWRDSLASGSVLELWNSRFDLPTRTICRRRSMECPEVEETARLDQSEEGEVGLLTVILRLTAPRKSSTCEPSLDPFVRADWAICLKYRFKPLKPWTWLSFLAASKTENSSSWSQISKWNVSVLLLSMLLEKQKRILNVCPCVSFRIDLWTYKRNFSIQTGLSVAFFTSVVWMYFAGSLSRRDE